MPEPANRRLTPFLLLSVFFLTIATSTYAENISEEWMLLKVQDSKIGFTHQRVEKVDAGYLIVSETFMKVQLEGKEKEISSSQRYILDKDLRAIAFTFTQKMGDHQQSFKGEIKNGRAKITISSGGNVTKREIIFPDTLIFAETAGYILSKKKLESGKEFKFSVFLEPTLTTEVMKIRIGEKSFIEHNGKEVEVFRVTATLSAYETTSYMTADGKTLREESPLGFKAIATTREEAISFEDGIMPFSKLLDTSLIPIPKPIEQINKLSKLTLTISGLSNETMIDSDSRQSSISRGTNKKDKTTTFQIEVKKEDSKKFIILSENLPIKSMGQFLKPTIEAESDNSSIKRVARKIIGNEKNGYRAALLINDYVYKNVRKTFIDTFSAVETLRTMEGECQSHTNLFAALAKSVGIPVKTISGIVYSEGYNGFLYHAWAEVYIGNGIWVAIDPTFGQETVDATHIKLIEGDLSEQMNIFKFIGKIDIEIVSTEYRT